MLSNPLFAILEDDLQPPYEGGFIRDIFRCEICRVEGERVTPVASVWNDIRVAIGYVGKVEKEWPGTYRIYERREKAINAAE